MKQLLWKPSALRTYFLSVDEDYYNTFNWWFKGVQTFTNFILYSYETLHTLKTHCINCLNTACCMSEHLNVPVIRKEYIEKRRIFSWHTWNQLLLYAWIHLSWQQGVNATVVHWLPNTWQHHIYLLEPSYGLSTTDITSTSHQQRTNLHFVELTTYNLLDT